MLGVKTMGHTGWGLEGLKLFVVVVSGCRV